VLDACAAPGGKTGHILELEPQLARLLAVDLQPDRLALLRRGLERQGRAQLAECRALDLSRRDALAGEPAFDRILLDAPCSATGVIRRHPDIKLLRRASDLGSLVALQSAILANLFDHLAPGGVLLYATCSVLPEENEGVVATFLRQTPAARSLPLPAGVALPEASRRTPHGLQLLPGNPAGTDGFYYARIAREHPP
jgi:16S rRNA (cytosine967-C5)-methyltransferase